MAEQLKEKMEHRRKVKILGICCIGSLLVAVITYGLLWTNMFGSMSWPGISAYVVLAVMLISSLSFCGLSIWILLSLTRNRTWAHKALLTVRAALVILLIAVHVMVGILAWNYILSTFGMPHRHTDVRLNRFAADGGVVIYICDAKGNFIVDENGKYVELYLKDDDKNGHVVKDALGRLITTDEDPLIAGAEDGVYYDPFEPAE